MFILGVLLTAWVVYDLFVGKVWSYREIRRDQEPGMYWFFTMVWALIAGSTLYAGLYWW